MSSPFLLRRSKRCHIGRRLVASLFLRAIVAAFVESAALHLHGALACKQQAPRSACGEVRAGEVHASEAVDTAILVRRHHCPPTPCESQPPSQAEVD